MSGRDAATSDAGWEEPVIPRERSDRGIPAGAHPCGCLTAHGLTACTSSFSSVLAARGLAEYYAWTGNAEESLTWLERAYAVSPVGEDFQVIASVLYDKVRNDPRFQAGLQRVRTEIYDRVQRARRGAELK